MKSVNHETRSNLHWPSVIQFSLSILAMLFLWGLCLLLSIMGLWQLMAAGNASQGAVSTFMMATASLTAGTLLIPSTGFALKRLMSDGSTPTIRTPGWFKPNLLILAFPLVLLVGYLARGAAQFEWLILPPLHVFAVGLPILWLIHLSVRSLPLGSPQRVWGVFGSGLVIAPGLILILEGLALIFIGVLAAFVIASRPEIFNEITALAEWLSTGNPTQEEILDAITPYLLQPGVIATALVFISILVPFIEELFKPIGVWLLWGRKMTPAAGFALGSLSGAGYAMFESMALSMGLENWPLLVVLRIGTAVMHILTSGMMGWALTRAWQKRDYVRLGLVFLGVISIHGMWNGLTLTTTFAGLAMQSKGDISGGNALFYLQVATACGLILLLIFAFITILWMNRRMVREYPRKDAMDRTIDKPLRDSTNEEHSNSADVL